jgi:hypothetical protein
MSFLTLLPAAGSFGSTGREPSGREEKAEILIALLPLIIAAQLNSFGSVANNLKYVSPCVTSSESFSISQFEHIPPVLKKSGRCKREEQVRKLVNVAMDSLESTLVKIWDWN